MSSFGLDRFRYGKDKARIKKESPPRRGQIGSVSPDSEKENLTVTVIPETPEFKCPSGSKLGKREDCVVLESDSDDDVFGASVMSGRLSTTPRGVIVLSDEEDSTEGVTEQRLAKLQELFPHIDRKELLEVIKETSTLDGAVACCTLRFRDEEPSRKRKLSGSDAEERNSQVTKKRKDSVTDDSAEEGPEPSWKDQEQMVRRLQRRFPSLDKEELRDVLQEHDWLYEDTMEALRMFSEAVDSASSDVLENTPENDVAPRTHSPVCQRRHSGSETDSRGTRQKSRGSPPSRGTAEPRGTRPDRTGATSSSALHRHPVRAKKAKAKAEGKSDVHRPLEVDSGSDGEGSIGSEFGGSSGQSDSDREDNVNPKLKAQILEFFQEASVDELSLIAGCSVKKAQKIVELRPFKTWEDLYGTFHKGNGLSPELVWGCRMVLKEREVVLGLMSKCEKISQKMVHDVTKVIKRGAGAIEQPSILNSRLELKPYQLIGLNWLVMLHQNQLSGILADEMGLGKTIQAISFLASLYQEGNAGPHLITVPSSTLDNWVRELKLWCPSLKVLVYYGSADDRRYLRHSILNKQVDFSIIVSTYNLTIGNDSDRSLFRKLKLQYAIFDEGHMLKNMNSLRYRYLMAINAKHRLLLTGTPLQNNLLELMSLLNFIMPTMFSSSTSQIAKMFSMKSSEEQSSFERDRIAQAKLIMKPFILRRVKSEVLKQLPEKEERVEFCPMSERQARLYDALFRKLKGSASGEKRDLCNVMMQLRKMANHPLLHRQHYTRERLAAMSQLMLKEPTHRDADPALIQEDMEVMSDFELHCLCSQYSTLHGFQLQSNQLLDSGKFAVLTELLVTLKDKGDRVVLFSQFTMMLDIVEVLLKHLNHRYLRLDGSTPMADRIGLIDEFNTDPDIFVFLLSTRAGGLGINLTSANVVILHDIDCNPYNDKQAEDRCHRVGQTRTVKVIKLVSKDSIEDCMLRVGQKKLKLEQDMTATEGGDEDSMPEDMASLLKASLGL
ncbi:SWI/SNF-related matrix-associated actin-dependent regulator of chromatin subfamily A containing DEAD/H box 1b [Brienomyrus brachyistius]|uniref:SWI/SNF-related matrix-associated actin-dependent regulator of chromatin subfamily A containing DEAD/H box 1b n=1 Tax=Brienomyrus brachyistius TaxID=42636 RepID=UPI0020B400F2|nr:SWI/SNF-related matrix-associated actin-dependent regulator of chromatin subfamily A containing DEAD/H box 1b [Brienomyrus brachyistius]